MIVTENICSLFFKTTRGTMDKIAKYALLGMFAFVVVSNTAISTSWGAVAREKPALDDKDPLLYDAQVYASNNNVSTEEALRRFQLQDIAGKLGAELSMNETETLAGLWIEHKPKFKIVVLFTRDGEETIKPYLKQYTELADIVEVRTANVSLANLQRDQADASSSANALGIRVQSDINVYNNSVELYITKADRSRFDDALQRREIRLPDTVRVITVEAEQMAIEADQMETDMPLLTSTAQASPEVPGFAIILSIISLLVVTICRRKT